MSRPRYPRPGVRSQTSLGETPSAPTRTLNGERRETSTAGESLLSIRPIPSPCKNHRLFDETSPAAGAPISFYAQIQGFTVLVCGGDARFDSSMDPRLFAEWAQIDEHLRRAISARDARRFAMDAVLIRQLVQRRLWDGRLPHGQSVEVLYGPGTRHTCDGCGTPIFPRETMTVRLDVEDWREMRFHQGCFEIWDDERLKDPLRKASHT